MEVDQKLLRQVGYKVYGAVLIVERLDALVNISSNMSNMTTATATASQNATAVTVSPESAADRKSSTTSSGSSREGQSQAED